MNRWLLTHMPRWIRDKGRDAPMDRTHSAYGIGKLDPNPTTIGDSKNWYTYSNNHIHHIMQGSWTTFTVYLNLSTKYNNRPTAIVEVNTYLVGIKTHYYIVTLTRSAVVYIHTQYDTTTKVQRTQHLHRLCNTVTLTLPCCVRTKSTPLFEY